MHRFSYEELITRLSVIQTYTLDEVIKERDRYMNIPRSIDSVKMLNKEYRTIEFDNIEENQKIIETIVSFVISKDKLKCLNYIIDQSCYYYQGPCNKPTWVRFNNTGQLKYTLTYNIDSSNEVKKTIFYTYYLLKTFRSCLNCITQAVEFIFSDKCKNKDILNHPKYNKGYQYYLTALDACKTMINELLMTCSLIIKASYIWVKDSVKELQVTPESVNIFNQSYYYNLTVNGSNDIKLQSMERLKEKFKKNNFKMYSIILDILQPCNFIQLCKRLLVYRMLWFSNIYIHNLINLIPSPEYVGNNIKITIDIE